MCKLTDAELKLQEATDRILKFSSDVVFELEEGRTVETQILIDVITVQSEVIKSLLNGFLEVN